MDKNTKKILNKLDRTIGKVVNWKQMSNVNNLLYFREKLKTETDVNKINIYQNRFDELKASIKTSTEALNF